MFCASRRRIVVGLVGLLSAAVLFAPGSAPVHQPDRAPSRAGAATGRVPLHFEPAAAPADGDFVARGRGYSLTAVGHAVGGCPDGGRAPGAAVHRAGRRRPGRAAATWSADRVQANYYTARNRTLRTGVPHFGRVAYDDVLPARPGLLR